MDIKDKTKEELIIELQELKQENSELKALIENRTAKLITANKELILQNDDLNDVSLLRQKAEKLLKMGQSDPNKNFSEAELLKLIHELEVHQIELELQNEELLLAKEQEELAREKYTSLFDFAPSAYFTLNDSSNIAELNLAGAQMLGKERQKLINSRLAFFMSSSSRVVFDDFLSQVFSRSSPASCEVTFGTEEDSCINALLKGTLSDDGKQCLITAVDITNRNKRELELRKTAELNYMLVALFANAPALTDKQLYDEALDIAVRITGSAIGFFHQVNDDQQEILLTTWNDEARKNCTTVYDNHYPIDKAGNWADCIRQKKPVVYNDYAGSPNRKGMPAGHAPVGRTMSVPVVHEEKVRLIFGVGNKTSDYTDSDVTFIQSIANELDKILGKRAIERNLQQIEDRWHFAIEGSNDGIWDWNVLTGDVYFSNRWKEMIGFEPYEIGEKIEEWEKRVHPDDWPMVKKTLYRHFNGENPQYFTEHRILCKDGSWKWVQDRGKVLQRTSEGKPMRMVGTYADITERKLAEEQIIRQATLINGILDTTPGFLVLKNNDGTYREVNAAFCNFLNKTRQEIIGKSDWELFPHHEAEQYTKGDNKVISSGIIEAGDWQVTGGKEMRWLNVIKNAVRNSSEEVTGVLCSVTDITERKQAEELMRRKEYDLRESQRIAHVGSWRLDIATNEVIWTEELYNMYGFDPSIPPPPYHEHMKLFTTESWERLSTALERTRDTGIPYTLELETIRKDGSNGWMWVRGEADVDAAGNTVALWGAAQDITERKIALNELRWRNEDLQLMNAINHAANSKESLTTIIDFIAKQLKATFNSHLLSIFIPDEERHELRMYGNTLDNVLVQKIEKVTGKSIPQIVLRMDDEHPFTEMGQNRKGLLSIGKKEVTKRLAGYLKGTPWPTLVQKFVKNLLPVLCDIIGYQSSAAVPMISNGKIVGYLELGSRDIMTERDLARIQSIADQFATVIVKYEAERNLRESEERMTSAFNYASIGMAFVSPDGRWLKVNPAIIEMLGYSEAELLSKSFQDITHPDDLSKDLDYVRQMLEGALSSYQMEKRYFHKSGSIIWVLLSVSLVHDHDGKPLHFISQIQNISERKQAEETIRQSEKKFRTLYETMLQGVIYQDNTGAIISANSAAERILGLSLEQMQDRTSIDPRWNSIHEDGSPFPGDTHPAMIALATGKENTEIMGVFNTSDEKYRWILVNAIPEFRNGDDKPFQVFTTFEDITELKNAFNEINKAKELLELKVEERTKDLREINAFQKAILDNAPFAILTTDTNGIFQSINPAGEAMTGYNADEVIGKLTPLWFHDREEIFRFCTEATGNPVPKEQDAYAAAMEAMFHKTTEWHWISKNGKRYPVKISHSSLIGADGILYGYMGLILDISKEKEYLNSLQESEERFHKMFQEHAAIMLLINPENGDIIQANDTAVAYYGLDFINTTINIGEINVLSPSKIKDEMEMAARQHRNYFIFPHKLANGEIRTVEVHSTPIEVSGNKVLFSIIHDITERKQAENALKKSEAENRAIIQAVPDLMFRIHRDGTYLDFQGKNDSSLYVSKEIFLGKKLSEVLPPELASESLHVIEKALLSGKVEQYEYMLTINEKNSYFENRIISISEEEVLSIIRDITQRKESEAALKLQSAAFESFALAIIITDIAGRIQWANSAFSRLTGYSVEEATGKMPGELVKSGKQDKEFYTKFRDTILSKKVWSGEMINRKKDGSLFYEEQTITPVLDSLGNISNFIAIKIDISERKKLFQALADEKRRLDDIVKGTNAGTWEWNIQTGETILNDQWALMLGYTLEDLSPVSIETWMKFTHPDDLKVSDELLKKHFKGDLVYYSFESRMKHKNGEWIWVLAKGRVHEWDADDKPLLMSGILLDITDRKKAEVEMLWNKSFLELMSNSSPLGFLVVDNRTDDILYFNHRFCKIWEIQHIEDQMQRGELKNNDIIPHCLPVLADVPAFTESYKPLQSETNRIVLEDEIAFTDNRTVRRFTTQIRGENDEYYGRFYIFEDITERKHTEAKLRESEEKHSAMISNISDVIGIIGIDGLMKYKSPNIEKHFGWKPEDLIGTDAWLTVSPDDLDRIQTEFYNLLQEDKSIKTVEYKYKCKNGSYKPIELTATNLVNNSIINGVLLNYHDITERKLGEAEIIRSKNEAEIANIAKSEFLSRMSHELRTPMNSILGFAQLMEMGELNPKQKKGVTHILNNGKHLLDLINEVLDISGIEAGRLMMIPEPVQLANAISEIADSIQVVAGKRKISIEFSESPANSLFVVADKLRLKQVLINLFGNAVKYNKEGGSITIQTRLQPDNEQGNAFIRISITDTGVGITPEDAGKLFQPFERIGADKTETEGTGLGLMIVKKITEAMGGTVGVDSEAGVGSTFWIELPQAGNRKDEKVQSISSTSPELRDASAVSTIFYIEDNQSNIELVEEILAEHRPEINLVTSKFGKQTIELSKKHKPGLILLDLDLPDINGIEVLAQLLADEHTKSIPVIIISADAMPFQVDKLMKAGAAGYLTKPLDVVLFLRTIEQHTAI